MIAANPSYPFQLIPSPLRDHPFFTVDYANLWVCREVFEIFRSGSGWPQPSTSNLTEASTCPSEAKSLDTDNLEVSVAEPSLPLLALQSLDLQGWVHNLPHPSLFPFDINKKTQLKAVPKIIEGPLPAYDYPAGTGVLIKFLPSSLANGVEPKVPVRNAVGHPFTHLHFVVDANILAHSIVWDWNWGHSLLGSRNIRS
jgi:hypothetical protein